MQKQCNSDAAVTQQKMQQQRSNQRADRCSTGLGRERCGKGDGD
jgi:hypothetical protein